MEEKLEFAQGLARKAGQIILDYFKADQKISYKTDNTPVTVADKLINSHVIERIAQTYPDHGVVGEEESTERTDQENVWICDPIDGTKAFTWGLPTAMFSLALVTEGRPVLGAAYDPFLDRMFTGIHGQGAFCNGEQLSVSKDNLQTGIMAATAEIEKFRTERYKYILDRGIRLAVFSGFVYKMCLVAEGRLVGHTEDNVGRHDIAAMDVIIQEAGGRVTDFADKPLDYSRPFKGTVVSNGVVHDELLKIAQIK
ncbi:MAG TPA: inositol monophosphatase [Candidatus Nitrosopolaris sp.]|nr:inositol monophosphatase [Candidatus Nitrosopolaris sp.]